MNLILKIYEAKFCQLSPKNLEEDSELFQENQKVNNITLLDCFNEICTAWKKNVKSDIISIYLLAACFHFN